MTLRSLPLLAVAAWLLAACGSSSPSGVKTSLHCSLPGGAVTLGNDQGVTLTDSELPNCLALPADGGTYLVVPQLASAAATSAAVSFAIGTVNNASPNVVALSSRSLDVTSLPIGRSATLQQRFDLMMLQRDHDLAARSGAGVAQARQRVMANRALASVAPPPAVGSTRTFQVVGNLSATTFKTDTAVLKYVGTNVLLYESQSAPSGGFTDAQLDTLGALFDSTLYGIDVRAFGPPTDIDNNGRVIVLMSGDVNAITPSSTCASQGYVAGFFYGADLIPSNTHSNDGEIYYSIVPDPNGTLSCAHSVAAVENLTGATFLHEVLHMINFGQKVIVHGLGSTEVEFLDEGMAKIAEEMGSRYYEARYPPPLGRTNPAQIFPDSAEGFITEDLFDSYDFLEGPDTSTTTLENSASTLADAGGEWLFLRWLGDQQDSTIYTRIVQSGLIGMPNLQTQAGESFPTMFGEFALAVFTDSLPGYPRNTAPATDRFVSRNLRQLFAALYRAVNGPTSQVPSPFPISLTTLSLPGTGTGTLRPGSMMFFRLQMPSSGPAQVMHFTQPNGTAITASLNPQVSVFRCPSAQACS